MEDQHLINALKNKDEAAYRELVLAYQEMIIATCYGFLRNQEEAEDVAQEVFIQVFRKIPSFRGEAKLSTWIYRIAVNRSLNRLRSKKSQFLVSLDAVFEPGTDQQGNSPLATLENIERAEHLDRAINKLPENQRTAFVLSKYDGLANKKIAEVMEMSLSAVEALLNRAKRNLQKHLVDYYRKNS
jgi:RNA polymerase sigma-70 factor (ECF subfamily)